MSTRVPDAWGKPPDFFFGNREAFKEMAADDVFPRWLRVTYAAYSHVGANGHAVFRQQVLAHMLGEMVDGLHLPAPRQRVREAIDGAVERGLLAPGSKALCLIVPRFAIAYGIGNETAPCRRHPRKRNAKTVSPDIETTRFRQVVSPQKERQNRVVSGSSPLFSLSTQPTTKGDLTA